MYHVPLHKISCEYISCLPGGSVYSVYQKQVQEHPLPPPVDSLSEGLQPAALNEGWRWSPTMSHMLINSSADSYVPCMFSNIVWTNQMEVKAWHCTRQTDGCLLQLLNWKWHQEMLQTLPIMFWSLYGLSPVSWLCKKKLTSSFSPVSETLAS